MNTDELRRNAILTALPEPEFERLGDQMELVGLADDGRVLGEVATVGGEGMVGLPLFLGTASSPHATFCPVPWPAARPGLERTACECYRIVKVEFERSISSDSPAASPAGRCPKLEEPNHDLHRSQVHRSSRPQR